MQGANRESVESILRAVLALGRRLRAERPQRSVSISVISILAALKRLGSVPAIRLAAEERLRPQSLTRILIGLEQDGLIVRRRSEIDRRESAIALTKKGERILARDMEARRASLETAVVTALNKAERDVLSRASEVMLKLAFHDFTTSD
jgi:DNA-binding MarR family transcriptional regulator